MQHKNFSDTVCTVQYQNSVVGYSKKKNEGRDEASIVFFYERTRYIKICMMVRI